MVADPGDLTCSLVPLLLTGVSWLALVQLLACVCVVFSFIKPDVFLQVWIRSLVPMPALSVSPSHYKVRKPAQL